MTLYIYDANGYIGDLCSNNGYKELVQQIPTQLEIITELFRDGIVAVDDNFLKEVKSLKGNEDVKNFKDLSLKCEETVIITDGVFDDGSEGEELEEKPKSISKQERWAKFEAKTLKQEADFKETFKKIFNEEGQEIVKYFEANQKLPDTLDDNKTAEKFKPLIEKTYLSGYEDAEI